MWGQAIEWQSASVQLYSNPSLLRSSLIDICKADLALFQLPSFDTCIGLYPAAPPSPSPHPMPLPHLWLGPKLVVAFALPVCLSQVTSQQGMLNK